MLYAGTLLHIFVSTSRTRKENAFYSTYTMFRLFFENDFWVATYYEVSLVCCAIRK